MFSLYQRIHFWIVRVVGFPFSDVDGTSCLDDLLECVDDGVMIVSTSKDEDKASEAGIER